MTQKQETVFVGLSGGVDSSVSAQRLIAQGYKVVGVFIKTWQPDFLVCDWERERLDAMRVAAHLGIPFYTCDAEEAYKTEVAEYMIREYTEGRTPNPDVMCNQHVKFGAFMKFAHMHGVNKLATGHYARVTYAHEIFHLYRGIDSEKDQSYFLWTLSQEQLAHTLFPVGDTVKSDIRMEAVRGGLPTSAKHDSQGICFLGQVDIEDFLAHYVQTEPGNVLDETGKCIGTHNGALFYTIGQRHGFTVHTSDKETQPQYVIAKDIAQNTITVSTEKALVTGNRILLTNVNKILGTFPTSCSAQFRYRQKPFTVQVTESSQNGVSLTINAKNVELPSVGQSCVLYDGDECLGGGIIDALV